LSIFGWNTKDRSQAKWTLANNLTIYREGTPRDVLQQYINPKYPESIIIGGLLLDWPTERQYRIAVDHMRNKLAPTDLTPTCVLCHKTNPEGVMIFLPLFKNRYKGYPIIGISWELARKEGLDSPFFMDPDARDATPEIAGWGFFCEGKCIVEFSQAHPELIIPVWYNG
jgi:hypothetical protein